MTTITITTILALFIIFLSSSIILGTILTILGYWQRGIMILNFPGRFIMTFKLSVKHRKRKIIRRWLINLIQWIKRTLRRKFKIPRIKKQQALHQ